VLAEEYLRPMKASGRNSTFKLVQAPFGGGKTHFLHCLRELAWQEGFCTAIVGLSPKACPFDRPVSIYREVARRIELPVEELDVEPSQGLDRVLRQLAEVRIEAMGAAAFKEWLSSEFSNASIESRSFSRAIQRTLQALADGDQDAVETLTDYLLGESVDKKERDPYRLREELDDENGFRWLRSLTQSLAALGLPGIVLMFDEMDRNMSLSVRRRREIGDNLRQMIDYCGQSLLPGVIWCYAVPPEFMDTIVPEYPALAQRLKGATRFSGASPMQPIIDLDHLPLGPTELLEAIGVRLLELTELGHGHVFDRTLQEGNLGELALELGERQFESGTRRTFVKAAITLLEEQRRSGDRAIPRDEIQRLAGTAGATGPDPMPGEAEF
jgi:BREX system ATP-binding protein BrxC/D